MVLPGTVSRRRSLKTFNFEKFGPHENAWKVRTDSSRTSSNVLQTNGKHPVCDLIYCPNTVSHTLVRQGGTTLVAAVGTLSHAHVNLISQKEFIKYKKDIPIHL